MTAPDPNSSLRGRLMLALVIPLGILFILGGVASFAIARHFADMVYDGWLFDSASSLALEVDSTPSGPSVDIPASTQRLFEWDVVDKTYFRIWGVRHGVIAGRQDLPTAGGEVDEMHGARFYGGSVDGHPVRIVDLPLSARQFGEVVHVQVAETMRKRSQLAHAILISTLVPQLLLILAAAIMIRRAVRHGLAPLRVIADRLRERSHRDHLPLTEVDVPREVRPLTRALNELLQRLESALSAQQRFVAEAAHQLRTPLTAIKLQVDSLRRLNTHDELMPPLDALHRSTNRAVRLSNQLLSLARAEPDGHGLQRVEPLMLVELVREIGGTWAKSAFMSGRDMQLLVEPNAEFAEIDGDSDLIREAVGNLIDNAMKYGKPEGRIRLTVSVDPTPTVTVEDDGPGIAPEQRPQMLRRFVRGGSGEGSGLGLAIAQEIARLHGGELILAEGSDGQGLSVRLRFPPAVAQPAPLS